MDRVRAFMEQQQGPKPAAGGESHPRPRRAGERQRCRARHAPRGDAARRPRGLSSRTLSSQLTPSPAVGIGSAADVPDDRRRTRLSISEPRHRDGDPDPARRWRSGRRALEQVKGPELGLDRDHLRLGHGGMIAVLRRRSVQRRAHQSGRDDRLRGRSAAPSGVTSRSTSSVSSSARSSARCSSGLAYSPHWGETEDPGLKLAVFSHRPGDPQHPRQPHHRDHRHVRAGVRRPGGRRRTTPTQVPTRPGPADRRSAGARASACRSAVRPVTRSTRPVTSARASRTRSCRSPARATRTGATRGFRSSARSSAGHPRRGAVRTTGGYPAARSGDDEEAHQRARTMSSRRRCEGVEAAHGDRVRVTTTPTTSSARTRRCRARSGSSPAAAPATSRCTAASSGRACSTPPAPARSSPRRRPTRCSRRPRPSTAAPACCTSSRTTPATS